ncbi:hypothetical protein ACI68E_003004 [Malassezia pachydermatis]
MYEPVASLDRGPSAQLIQMLESSQKLAPDTLWALYTQAMSEVPQKMEDGSLRQPQPLAPTHHQLVLESLLPPHTPQYEAYEAQRRRTAQARYQAHVDEQDGRALDSEGPVDLSTPRSMAPVPPVRGMGGRTARVFAQRASQILRHIPIDQRTTELYNRVLAVLSHGGRYKYMRSLWNDMVNAREQGYTNAAPNQATCHHMMMGLARNVEQKLARFRAMYRHELLAPVNRRPTAVQSEEAAAHVQASVDQAASTVLMLLRDIQRQGTLPRVRTLDVAARLLRATGQLPPLLELLRYGFGMDLQHPDTEAPSLCAPTTYTLNTTLMALGEMARASDMSMAYEVMTQRLPTDSTVAVAPVLPNTTSYKLMIRHAVSVPKTLLVSKATVAAPRSWLARLVDGPQSTPTIGIHTPAQRDAEMLARCRGDYLYLARTYVNDALDTYAAQLQHLAEGLQVSVPLAVSQSMDEIHTRAHQRRQAAEEAHLERPLRSSRRLWSTYHAVDADMPSLLAASEDDVDATPTSVSQGLVFVPPRVRVTWTMLRPLLDAAKARRSTGQLLWLHPRADRAEALLAAEYDVLTRAHAAIDPMYTDLLQSLLAHRDYVKLLLQDMSWLCDSRLPGRVHGWRMAEQHRNAKRNERAAAKQHGVSKKKRRASSLTSYTSEVHVD